MDERFETVEEAIRDTLLLLVKQKDPQKITVTELCRKAGIVRSAFYNHYEDMPALITSVQNRSIEEIFQMMEDFYRQGAYGMSEGFYLSLCRYIAENSLLQQFLKWPGESKEFFERALGSFYGYALHRGSYKVSDFEQMKQTVHRQPEQDGQAKAKQESDSSVQKNHSSEMLPNHITYALAYAMGGAAGILHHWVAEDLATPPEEVAKSLTKLFEQGAMTVLGEQQ